MFFPDPLSPLEIRIPGPLRASLCFLSTETLCPHNHRAVIRVRTFHGEMVRLAHPQSTFTSCQSSSDVPVSFSWSAFPGSRALCYRALGRLRGAGQLLGRAPQRGLSCALLTRFGPVVLGRDVTHEVCVVRHRGGRPRSWWVLTFRSERW